VSTQRLTTADLHWTAGFLEGEGSFGRGGSGLTMQASQVQKEPLEKLHRLFGGDLHLQKDKRHNHSDCWYWTLSSRAAAATMMTLYTLMSIRRKQQIEQRLSSWKRHSSQPSRKYRGIRYVPLRYADRSKEALTCLDH